MRGVSDSRAARFFFAVCRRGAFALVALATLITGAVRADPIDPKAIPEPLKPWAAWAVEGKESASCPGFQAMPDLSRCIWPTRLSLMLDDKGGRFEQTWHVDVKGWVPLPGSDTRWPLDVQADSKKVVVAPHDGGPGVLLAPGDHRIQGVFVWESMPDSLPVPLETGIVDLTVRGTRVAEPSRDDSGRVFLQKTAPATEAERIDIVVHRRVTDEVPVELTTRVVLNVSGKNREVVLGRSLPNGFLPTSIKSDLPARIEPDTRLRVQVRPGTWTIEVAARSEGPVATLARPNPDGPWRGGEEVWVFEARNALRLVSIEGARAVDPQQTSLPDAWKALPAYAMAEGDTLRLVEKRRGDVDAPPDELTLARTLWLDFDGKGYTANDTIGGTLHRASRLEMNPPMTLGRVSIDGKDQFITRSANDANKTGVEVRPGDLHLTADSRVGGDARDIPAVGYDHDFHQVSASLHLPPGFRLFHASGADEVPGTWVRHWTLLEIFLVLVLSLSFGKLFGPIWGLLAGATFALVFPEIDLLKWLWPPVLAVEALLRVVPDGKVKKAFFLLRIAALCAVVLGVLPFAVQHVREGIYPALAEDQTSFAPEFAAVDAVGAAAPAAPPAVEAAAGKNEPAREEAKDEDEKGGGGLAKSRGSFGIVAQAMKKSEDISRQFNSEAYDPNAVVQTGPGLPTWQWTTTTVSFSGPVERTQRLHLYLLSPAVNLFLALLRAALLAALVYRLVPFRRRRPGRGSPAIAAAVVCAVALFGARSAHAEVPPQELVDQLRDRLLAKPDCAPTCASLSRMLLEANGPNLRALLEVSASSTTAVPLPGAAPQWSPETVIVDGKPASGLDRTNGGKLWLRLEPGTHDVVVEGALPNRESVQIALAMKPHHVEAKVDGWLLEGLHEDGLADDSLQLTRVHPEETSGGALGAGTLPPFVRLERTLQIGLDWQLATHIVRITPPGSAAVMEVPLLAGESVTTAEIRVVGGKAQVNMAADQTEVSWHSVFAEKSPIQLTAAKTVAWTEVWRLDLSPIWHAELSGIPLVQSDPSSRIAEWRPWPGETATIELTRPAGVTGQTLTVDSSTYEVRPGLRAADATLRFTARSSRGGEHVVRLPEAASLESVSINGSVVPVRQQGQSVTLPISPGTQNVELKFRISDGFRAFFHVPAIDFGTPTVNASTRVRMSDSRWILFVHGPRLGPAVLFWSLLLVLCLVAYALGAVTWVPLRRFEWMLLAIGLSQVPLPAAAIVVGWLLVLGLRRLFPEAPPIAFDLRQLVLVAWTFAALGVLVFAIQQGLVGTPEMQIQGNGSSSELLQWFDDRTGNVPEAPFVLSVSLFVYRAAMLAWALWLAISILRWLRWGWESFSTGGLWKKRRKRLPPPAEPTEPVPVEPSPE